MRAKRLSCLGDAISTQRSPCFGCLTTKQRRNYAAWCTERMEITMQRSNRMKVREYRLRRNADKRLATLQAKFPERRFWVAPTQSFKFAVFTAREAPKDDPNAIGVGCA